MEVVVDASVAVKWFVRDAGSERAIAILDDVGLDLVAPDLFDLEVRNGLLKQSRLGALNDALLDRALTELDAVMPRLVSSQPLLRLATDLARRAAHPLYDCLYLALAERLDTTLVTADAAFVARCHQRLADDPITGRLRDLSTPGLP